jgi:hypothetical protein
MKVLELLLDLLLRVLNYVDQQTTAERQEKLKDDYESIRRNPRDLFDDGVLNNSASKATDPDPTVPKP